jgi:hypothetical protein
MNNKQRTFFITAYSFFGIVLLVYLTGQTNDCAGGSYSTCIFYPTPMWHYFLIAGILSIFVWFGNTYLKEK